MKDKEMDVIVIQLLLFCFQYSLGVLKESIGYITDTNRHTEMVINDRLQVNNAFTITIVSQPCIVLREEQITRNIN